MATTAGLFQLGDRYRKLHGIATSQPLNIDLAEGEYAVGVLEPGKDESTCQNDQFLFFKVKAKHSVGKLRGAYQKKSGIEVEFKFAAGPVNDTTQMKPLDLLRDGIIVFTAHASPPMATPDASVRNPLQPVNTQISATCATPNPSAIVIKAEKLEPPLLYGPPRSRIPPSANAAFKNESTGTQPSQHQSSSTRSFEIHEVGPKAADPSVKSEGQDHGALAEEPSDPKSTYTQRIDKLIQEASPEILEAEVRSSQSFLSELKQPMMAVATHRNDAMHWVKQIGTLEQREIDKATIIGVVGNTGAGKSSVINAMLEEERLVPTNCMRACTAVVTEISWNSCNDPDKRYRADIEFISADEWQKDLGISLRELLDNNGEVSRECTNLESEAGIAYAKVKAVYPQKTKDMLAKSSVEDLMSVPEVEAVLGKTRSIATGLPSDFYKRLQKFVDSQEKSTEDKKKKKQKGEKKGMEFWPLIKVVKIYVKAEALSTGAVIVDLPGVHDSNAARAAVASGYMKQCTGLFIVAPINRAVDDKAAKSLLGESFKRQLKFDGSYSRITFICSKTDDISVMEASTSLGLEEQTSEDWDKIDALERKDRSLKQSMKDLNELKSVFSDVINDCDDKIEIWESLQEKLEEGETVYAPREKSNKRKRTASPKNLRKKTKMPSAPSNDEEEDDFIDDDDDEERESEEESGPDEDTENEGPLALEAIEAKLAELKAHKKTARRERMNADLQVKEQREEVKEAERQRLGIETGVRAICIEGRNKYSKGAIQQDFADGIRELDVEAAQNEDPDQFNPEEDLRDYEEVARTLPVFCVSSRAYQKLSGRFIRDGDIQGFRSSDETEIPQLQAHCKKLTECGRVAACREFLTELSQLLNSLGLWASNDGTGMNMTDAQLENEAHFLKKRLNDLEKGLDRVVKDCMRAMNDTFASNIFENYPQLIDLAVREANGTVNRWNSPINRENRPLGGYFWATYKAICRREGVFSNAQGPHDFNAQLIEPIIKHLASHWEKTFAQRLPRVLKSFGKESRDLLTSFHEAIDTRYRESWNGSAGILTLNQQLRTYDNIFNSLTVQLTDLINHLQRDANREFTPVIARALASAYDSCAVESGPGQFIRMKRMMSEHVEGGKAEMFTESCNEVKTRLISITRQVEEIMSTRAEEVFMNMQRDYMEVVTGSNMADGQMSRWERAMRANVCKVIEEKDLTAEEDAKKAAEAIAAERAAERAATAADQAGIEAEETGGDEVEDGV